MPRVTAEDRAYQYYPAFLDLRRKRVVVVGGGEIATGKVRGLLPCGPEPLVVIAPEVTRFIRVQAERGAVEWLARPYREGDLAGAELAFAATDNRALNAVVAAEARAGRVPVLAVDDVPNCDFIAPSLVKRGDLILAFSTGGRSPAMARWVRERFDREVPAHWAALLDLVGTARDRLGEDRKRIPPDAWLAAIDDLEALLTEAEPADPEQAVRALLERLQPEGVAT